MRAELNGFHRGTTSRRLRALILLAMALEGSPKSLLAQTKWEPANQVRPKVTTTVQYDSVRRLWIYDYSVQNGGDAKQPIVELVFERPGNNVHLSAPAGWVSRSFPDSIDVPDEGRIAIPVPFMKFTVDAAWDESTGLLAATFANVVIQPGRSLGGFRLMSSDPPGDVVLHVRGFTPLTSEETSLPANLPTWLEDARTVVVRGPRRPM